MSTFNIDNWKREFDFLPLGIRCNNLGCIRYTDNMWNGLKDNYHGFCRFTDFKYGVRALTFLLMRYLYKYRLFDIRSMIARYAPSSDGNFPYIYSDIVTKVCAVSKLDTNIALLRIQLPLVVHAIAQIENGEQYIKSANNEDYRTYLFNLVREYIDEYLNQVVYPAKGKIQNL